MPVSPNSQRLVGDVIAQDGLVVGVVEGVLGQGGELVPPGGCDKQESMASSCHVAVRPQ